jgi:HAD superfamily hydrolase (TIGR01490 family)
MRDEHSSCKPGPCRVGADQEERTALLPIHASDSLRTESGGYGNERAIQVCTAHTTEAQGSYRSPRLRWCRRRDLNPHGLRHTPLKRACLPFHHFGNLIRDAPIVKRRSIRNSDASQMTRGNQREAHYRSGPKSLSINRRSGRIGRRMLTGTSNTTHSLTPTLDEVGERQTEGSIAALFDVDNTLLPGEASEVRFFRFLWRRGLVGWSELRRSAAWLAGHVPPFSLHSLRERKVYLAGKRPADIESYAREFCQTEMIDKVSPQGRASLEAHRQAGHQLILVTGAPDFLIEPLARFLDVPTFFAAKLEQQNSAYTGGLIPPLPYGRGKRELILTHARTMNLDLAGSYAYGDSPGDHDLLELVGHPLVINPIRGMARTAQRRGWPITTWK